MARQTGPRREVRRDPSATLAFTARPHSRRRPKAARALARAPRSRQAEPGAVRLSSGPECRCLLLRIEASDVRDQQRELLIVEKRAERRHRPLAGNDGLLQLAVTATGLECSIAEVPRRRLALRS